MPRDKAKDDLMFNCTQDHEREYVSSLYGANKAKVAIYLINGCASNKIKNTTHKALYAMIERDLGLPVPN